MPPVIAVVASLVAAYGWVAVVVGIITLASVAYSAYMMASMENPSSSQSDAQKRLNTIRSSIQPHRIVYGEVMTGGVLVYVQSHSVDPETGLTVTGDNVYISLVVAFTGHEIEEIKEVWLNDKLSTDPSFSAYVGEQAEEGYWQQIDDYGTQQWVVTKAAVPGHYEYYVNVRKYLGTTTQTADSFLVSLPPNPTSIITKQPESGLNDLSVVGDYSIEGMAVFTIIISTIGSVDTFNWHDDHNNSGSNVSITANNQLLVNGIYVKFNAVTGHSVGQTWEIRAFDGAPWTADCTLTGRSYVVVTLKKNDTAFPNGLPNIKALIRGNNQIYDPRGGLQGSIGYTDNWALCIRDYLTKKYGLNAPSEDINDTYTITAANICDELVTLANGSTEKRYTMNGSFTVDKTPTDIMNEILLTAYGMITWTQGQYRIFASAYVTPDLTFTGINPDVPGLTESDLRGPIKVRPIPSMKDKFNTVKGTYISTETWQSVDFPKVKNDTYIAEDGGNELVKDVQFSYITSPAMAQRVAKILLERNRQNITVEFPAKWSAFPLAVGDNVPISISHLGWDQKIFNVRDWKMNPEGGVDLTLIEEASACYDWNSGEETTIDLAQNTILADPRYVPIPTNLTIGEELYATNVPGIIKSRAILTWDELYVKQYELNYLPPNNTIWAPLPLTTDTTCTIDDTIPGTYNVKIRAMNFLGVWSDWAYALQLLKGKTALPSDVSGIGVVVTRGQLRIFWNPISDLDVAGYELQLGTVWDDPSNTILVKEYSGTSFSWTPNVTGTITFLVKAYDTSGNWSLNASSYSYVVSSPGAVTNLTQKVIDNIVELKWTPGTIGTFPIDYYVTYKGTDFATATFVNRIYSTTNILSETISGTFKYWLVAVDVAGLTSDEIGVYAKVDQPPDYILLNDQNGDLSTATLVNALYEPTKITLPVNLTETFEQHFINNSFTSPSDQITAGYPVYCQPGLSSGSITFIVDYGAVIPSTKISMSVTRETISGTVTFAPEISTSTDGSSYTVLTSTEYEIFAQSFRYVRYKLNATSSDGGVASVSQINVKLDVKERSFVTTVDVTDTTGDGTETTFASIGITPVDIVGISASAPFTNNTTNDPIKALINFADTAYPTSFKTLAYNKSNVRVACNDVVIIIRYI